MTERLVRELSGLSALSAPFPTLDRGHALYGLAGDFVGTFKHARRPTRLASWSRSWWTSGASWVVVPTHTVAGRGMAPTSLQPW